jgi:hypothetical protein
VRDQRAEGVEIIGYDHDRQTYLTQYFGSDGPASCKASFGEVGGAVTWTMRRQDDRFTDTFSHDGNSISGHWERRESAGRRAWMDITLTRQDVKAQFSRGPPRRALPTPSSAAWPVSSRSAVCASRASLRPR